MHVCDNSGLASEEVRCSVSAGDIQYNALQRSSIPLVCVRNMHVPVWPDQGFLHTVCYGFYSDVMSISRNSKAEYNPVEGC